MYPGRSNRWAHGICVIEVCETITAEEVKTATRDYITEKAIMVFEEPDRPQPRLDRDISGGYAVSVGCVREGKKGGHFDIRFAALSHNTVIGAAGSSILNQMFRIDSNE